MKFPRKQSKRFLQTSAGLGGAGAPEAGVQGAHLRPRLQARPPRLPLLYLVLLHQKSDMLLLLL